MNREIYISLLLLISYSISLVAQHDPFCGSDEYEQLLLQNADYQAQAQKEEKAYRANALRPKIQKRNSTVTIPVVFHIIHNNGPENISDDQVIQGLEHLNQAFANEGSYQNDEGVDTKIRFCLAQRDDNGDEINGIYRYESPFTDMSIFEGYEYVKSRKIDSTQYINIQIVKNACLGSDCSPAGFAGEYRIVVAANTIDNTPLKATVLVHEMGHYLGLKHTWHGGCKNDDCLKDGDKVCDTPPDNRTYDGCDAPSNSCFTDEDDTSNNNPYRSLALGGLGDQPDDKINFMDYNIRSCRDKFTQGQADRMSFFLENKYDGLLNSKGCLPPCETFVSADFDLPDSIVVSGSFDIMNQSINADNYQWYVDGVPISTLDDLDYTFLVEGLINVQLEAYTNDTLCESDIITKTIRVYCPIVPCFDYQIEGPYLVFEDCSQNADVIEWTVNNGSGDIMYNSALAMDSLYVNNIDFVRLCLTVHDEHCSDLICEHITITSDGSEVCGNEEDDDGDGLIDLYDLDCPCEDGAYQANCPVECEILPDSFPEIKMKMKWESEKISGLRISTSSFSIGNVIQNDGVSIISPFHKGGIGSSHNYIATFRADNGLLQDTFRILPDYSFFELATYTAVAKDKFSDQYFIYGLARDTLFCMNESGVEIFKKGYDFKGRTIGVADFNGDGFFEVYIGRIILNGQTGEVLIDESNSCDDFCYRNISIAADVLGDDGLPELISGQYVFDVNIINTNDSLGNSVVVTQAPIGVGDGKCAVADVNGDGQLEVIVVQSNNGNTSFIGNLSVWNPRNQMLLAQIPNPILGTNNWDGSIPFVGDVDGDCIPEIGVVYNLKFTIYKYVNSTLEEMYSITTTDRSGITGITMFDFNQDDRQELIYRDETHLRIFSGETGETIDSTIMYSGTLWEYPIVADVDNDGQAEIIVSGSRTSQDEVRMYCFESATTPWAPARSVWNQYAYNPTQVNDDLTIPRYQQNAAQPLQGTENCPRETCNTPYNNFMVQATYRTQEGCYVWPELQRDLSISAESRCIGDSTEICFYVSSTDTTIISEGVTINCYPPSWDDNIGVIIQSIDEIVVTTDTTCIMMSILNFDSLLIVVNDDGGLYPPYFPTTEIEECDYTNNEFVLHLGGPDFSIDIIDWECSPDSLIFYIATDNVGLDTDVSCIEGGCYFTDPNMVGVDPQQSLLEVTTWCFDFDTTTMTYQYQDTFRVTIPHPNGQSQMWWTINEGGFAPGVLSSEATGIYECNYNNNTDSIAFDISEKELDLGSDIIKCSTEVFTLNAGSGFENYLWNDLTTDSIYSAIEEGIHYIEATDQCGRIYHDTIMVTIDDSEDINLGPDFQLCYDQDTVLTIIGDYDEVFWSPSELVDCDTCMNTAVNIDTMTTLYVQARKGNCMSYDTIVIERILPLFDTVMKTSCVGDTIDFFGQSIIVDGIYERLSSDCSRLDVLEATFTVPDTTHRIEQICSSDSILFDGQYLNTQGIYEMTAQNILGCDSTIILDLEVVEMLANTDTLHICEYDSIQIFGEWISHDTIVARSYISSAGCDSTHTISVISNLLPTNDFQVEVCEGDSVFLYGTWYKDDGLFDALVPNIQGCDSLISLEIITKANFATYDTITACKGDTIQVFSTNLTSSEDVWESYVAENGCDSVSYYHVNFVEVLESSEELVLCPGDSILINSEWVKTEGVYEIMHVSEIGCDSIHRIYVSMVPDPPSPQTEINCEELEIKVRIDGQTVWNPIWNNGDTTDQTIYPSGIMEASLLLYTQPNCEKQFTISLPQLPNIDEIPSTPDTTLTIDNTILFDLGLDPNEWSVLWNDASIVDCDTCMAVEISPRKDTEMTIYLTHQTGCTYESSFLIRVEKEEEGIYVPNIFSPNGDNNNDSWSVFSTANIQITACNVYDRWGNIVYTIKGNQLDWNGKFNGIKVEQGVYIYMIKYIDSEGQQRVKFGDITLIR